MTTDKLQALRIIAKAMTFDNNVPEGYAWNLRALVDKWAAEREPEPPSYTCECCARPTNTLYACEQILEGLELCFECMNTELSGEAQRRLKSLFDLTTEENRFGDVSTPASVETEKQRRELWGAFEVRCVANSDGRCE